MSAVLSSVATRSSKSVSTLDTEGVPVNSWAAKAQDDKGIATML